MYRGRSVCVVVPAHNEERHIGSVISGSPELVDHIVVIDDRSSDDTVGAVLRAGDARVTLLQHSENQGVGGALISGYREALRLNAGLVAVMAGDGQMDPQYLPTLFDPICLGQAEATKGNRFYSWASLRRMPAIRMLGTLGLTWLTRAATGYWHLSDAQNGYVALSGVTLARVNLDSLDHGYAVENAMLIELSRNSARVMDIPIPARYGSEVSGMRIWRDGPLIASVLLRGIASRLVSRTRSKP